MEKKEVNWSFCFTCKACNIISI